MFKIFGISEWRHRPGIKNSDCRNFFFGRICESDVCVCVWGGEGPFLSQFFPFRSFKIMLLSEGPSSSSFSAVFCTELRIWNTCIHNNSLAIADSTFCEIEKLQMVGRCPILSGTREKKNWERKRNYAINYALYCMHASWLFPRSQN